MEIGSADLTEVVRSVRLLKINGYSMIYNMGNGYCFSYRWIVDEYEWDFRVYPCQFDSADATSFVTVRLFLLSEVRDVNVSTVLRCCLVDPTGMLKPSKEDCQSWKFWGPEDSCPEVILVETSELEASGYVKGDSFTVKFTLEVFKELSDITTTPLKELTTTLKELHPPSPNLHQHFAQLLQNETGADVTFIVSGESFAAHKLILAARSPIFMAEFFGDMKEKCSQCVEIEDMEAPVFKALLRFMYTDTVPEFRHQDANVEAIYTITLPEFAEVEADAEVVMLMAQHLLAAADRYGLDKLKLICAGELSGGINVDTAATTLALAEQHNCGELKERCVEFIIRTSGTLDAVLLTEGYKHLEASCPLVVIDLLKAARGKRN